MLDSGTLTPLLKKLEAKGLVVRRRDLMDERSVKAIITEDGIALKEKAKAVPEAMSCQVKLSAEEYNVMRRLLDKIMTNLHSCSE